MLTSFAALRTSRIRIHSSSLTLWCSIVPFGQYYQSKTNYWSSKGPSTDLSFSILSFLSRLHNATTLSADWPTTSTTPDLHGWGGRKTSCRWRRWSAGDVLDSAPPAPTEIWRNFLRPTCTGPPGYQTQKSVLAKDIKASLFAPIDENDLIVYFSSFRGFWCVYDKIHSICSDLQHYEKLMMLFMLEFFYQICKIIVTCEFNHQTSTVWTVAACWSLNKFMRSGRGRNTQLQRRDCKLLFKSKNLLNGWITSGMTTIPKVIDLAGMFWAIFFFFIRYITAQ